jgi:endo-1,4-beta-xylanase
MKKNRKKFTTIALILLVVFIMSSLVINAATPTGTRLKNIQSRVLIGTEFPSNFNSMSDTATFTSMAAAEFNMVTPENAMKWDATEPSQNSFNYGAADTLVNWAQSNGFKVHGHTFVWHAQTPSWVQNLSASALQSAMNNHITNLMNHFRNKILVWDVVNEAFNEDGTYRNSFWYSKLGKVFIENAFKQARATDSSVKLIYNDYNLEATGGKSNGAYNMLKDFKSRGIPVDGIGFQMHLDIQYGFNYNDFASNMQRFADLGLEIYITEMDVRVSSNPSSAELQTQADYYKGVIQKCMAQPAVKAIQIWGFTDKYSWVPGTFPGRGAALIFDSNYNPKPSYYAVQSALGSPVTVSPTRPTTATPTPTQGPTATPTPTNGPRSAYSQIEAESYNTQSGIQTESCGEGGQNIGYIENGDYVVYNSIDFGTGATGFQARVASATSGGNIEIRLDSASGSLVGTCSVAGTGGWQTWTTRTCTVSGASGTHNLYLRFTGGSGYLMNLNWFKFTSGTVTPTNTPTPTQGNTPTATPTPTNGNTPTPTPTPVPGGYVVTYTISDWGGAGNVDVVIKNNTANAVNGWTLAWTFPGTQKITNMWNASYTQSGASVSATNLGYNNIIAANGGTVSFGFSNNYTGSNTKPTSFTLNGTACQIQ